MRRIAVVLIVLSTVGVAWFIAPARAQLVSSAQLAGAALSPGEIPGFSVVSEDYGGSSLPLFQNQFTRVLRADDASGTGSATVTITLQTPRANADDAALQSTAANGSLFTGLPAAVFLRLSGTIGIGTADESANWQQWNIPARAWDAYYSDSFLQGRLLAIVTYSARAGMDDPTFLADLAAEQALKLVNASLPGVLLAPLMVSTPVATSSPAASPSPAPAFAPGTTPGPAATPTSGLAAPLQVTASLNSSQCTGGNVRVTAIVSDGNGAPVAGAAVAGEVQYRTSSHQLTFPNTGADGQTNITVDTGLPGGGYTIVWNVFAAAAGLSASTSTNCFAP